jgi:hypothetical protein
MKDHKVKANKRQRALQREEHFNNGGTLADWRGRAYAEEDKKKAADKDACREHITDDDDGWTHDEYESVYCIDIEG